MMMIYKISILINSNTSIYIKRSKSNKIVVWK